MQRGRLFQSKNKHDINKIRDEAMSLAAGFLPVSDQLHLRATNRANREAVQRTQRGPYQSRAAFAMAFSGLFTARIGFLLERAWQDYRKVMAAESDKPAMLYRLDERQRRNPRYVQKLIHFKAGENIEEQQRIYQPPDLDHFWAYNLVWMLAQIHKRRAFAILSDITDKNFKSKSKWLTPSAFAKEITAALLAGYTPATGRDDTIDLLPPDAARSAATTILDVRMQEKVIKQKYYALQPLQAHAKKFK